MDQTLGVQMAAHERERASRHAGARADFLKVAERDVELADRPERARDAPDVLAGASELRSTRGLGQHRQHLAQAA